MGGMNMANGKNTLTNDEYIAMHHKYASLGKSGLSPDQLFAQLMSEGVSRLAGIALLRDFYEFGLKDGMDADRRYRDSKQADENNQE